MRGTDEAAAIEQAKTEFGVTFLEFGDEDSAAFRAMTDEVWTDWGAKSADAQAIVDSHRAFMATLGLN